MKLGIVGSRKRTFKDDYLIIFHYVCKIKPTLIISGGAKGIDTLAKKVAKFFNIPIREYLPNRSKYKTKGNNIYFERNKLIAQASDILLALPINMSGGTMNTVKWFKQLKPNNRLIIENQKTEKFK